MKFFDHDWMNGTLSDAEYEERIQQYNAHIELIRASLPQSLLTLSQSGVLHDALVEAIRVDNKHNLLLIELLGGNVQAGYWELHLRYGGFDLDDASRVTLQNATSDPATELLYDELDLCKDGRFEHRLLWWPYRELTILFQTFDLATTPRANRQRRSRLPQYSEIP